MNYDIHSFRYGLDLFQTNPDFIDLWNEIQFALNNITDQDLINYFNANSRASKKSLSEAINTLVDERLIALHWNRQSPIFNNSEYRPTSKNRWWTLDFTKEALAVEVAFNHGEAVAWNLIKPVLSSELNHVEKAIQTNAGIIITAKDSLKRAGNFDSAIGTYEKFLQYLAPFGNILSVPMVIIGLDAPETFFIDSITKKVSYIETQTKLFD
ncbi:hypothetical protein A9986_09675 [Solibacillus silvestris]|nr:BglII/BstYI family type II restriction endonuclease [Solibacillus silvestris]OBW57007.1 hypothetical protein A9986_09675 [Solibacillus silvestris]